MLFYDFKHIYMAVYSHLLLGRCPSGRFLPDCDQPRSKLLPASLILVLCALTCNLTLKNSSSGLQRGSGNLGSLANQPGLQPACQCCACQQYSITQKSLYLRHYTSATT